jgi:DNA-binding transcriptional regulator GbsR (MarR family)
MTRPTPAEQKYVEDFGLYWEAQGLPRTTGRILAWLLICDPPHQTMHELTDALQTSKSSISTASRMLIQMGMIERISLPGERRDYYRLLPHVWADLLVTKRRQFTDFRQLAERGLALLPPNSSRGERLQEMRDLYAFMEQEYPELLTKWQESRG